MALEREWVHQQVEMLLKEGEQKGRKKLSA